MPSEPPQLDEADIAATSTYCDEPGGDYYGFIRRTTADGEGLIVAVGNVSGHGMHAGQLDDMTVTVVRSR